MMIQLVDKPKTAPIGQDRETLLKLAVHMQVCRLFNVVYIVVELGYPAITNIFVVNQIFRYNGVFAITKTPL